MSSMKFPRIRPLVLLTLQSSVRKATHSEMLNNLGRREARASK
jgi:hypothetical protein